MCLLEEKCFYLSLLIFLDTNAFWETKRDCWQFDLTLIGLVVETFVIMCKVFFFVEILIELWIFLQFRFSFNKLSFFTVNLWWMFLFCIYM